MIPVLLDLDEEDIVKWILVFLYNRRLTFSGVTLEKESGVANSGHSATDLRQMIIKGDWEKAHKFIQSQTVNEVDLKRIRFLLKRQQLLEYIQRWKDCVNGNKSIFEGQERVHIKNGISEEHECSGKANGCIENEGYVQEEHSYTQAEECAEKEIVLQHFSELKELYSGDNDFSDLSRFLDFDCSSEDLDSLQGRVKCFSAICNVLSKNKNNLADKTDDRLIELLVKGYFFESWEKYFRSKLSYKEFGTENEQKLAQSSNVDLKSLVAKLLSDIDMSLPFQFSSTAEMIELKTSIKKLGEAPLNLDVAYSDKNFKMNKVTVIQPTQTSLHFSTSDASGSNTNQKSEIKQEISSLLLEDFIFSKSVVLGDCGHQNLPFLYSDAKMMRGVDSNFTETSAGNALSTDSSEKRPSRLDVDFASAVDLTEVSNCESANDTDDGKNSEEMLEKGVDVQREECEATKSLVKNKVVFRRRQHCCEFCGKLMRSSSEMLRHMHGHRPDADQLVHKCRQCLRLFADKASLEGHKRLHEEPLHCTICRRSFVDRAKLQQHVMKSHTRKEVLSCIPCNESFLSDFELETHMNCHLSNQVISSEIRGTEGETVDKREFACDRCGKRFSGSGALRKHMQSHMQERPYGCMACGKKFLRLEHLQLHERIHSGEKPFQCKICDYSSRQQSGLKSHMKQHSRDNPFSCPGCGKQFSLLCRLKTHLLDATNKREYSCSVCHVEFQHACALRAHAKTHALNDNKRFVCDVCGQRFSRKHDMMVHQMLHSNAKPYICAICKSGFSSKSYVKEHLGCHTGDDRCVCKACNLEFKDLAELLTHMELHIEGDWLKCRICCMTLANGAEFREHKSQHCAKKLSSCSRGKQLK